MDFNAAQCDLCGSDAKEILLETTRSMTSDSRLTSIPLQKVACAHCGLVRNGHSETLEALETYYESNYVLNHQAVEHTFVIEGLPQKRSQVICQWIESALNAAGVPTEGELLEVGCGAGELLSRLPFTNKKGIELNAHAAQLAREKGLAVTQGGYEAINGTYDVIVSFGVIEHVPSPSDFLKHLRRALKPNGVLVVGQPMQDVPSYDVFFSDHLHHFFVAHLSHYFQKEGFTEHHCSMGYGPITNFSVHVAGLAPIPEKLDVAVDAKLDVSGFQEQFLALNAFLEAHHGEVMYAFGQGECLTLYQANTQIDDYIAGVVDDYAPHAQRLTEVSTNDPIWFILTLNPAYQAAVTQRIRSAFPKAQVYSVQEKRVV